MKLYKIEVKPDEERNELHVNMNYIGWSHYPLGKMRLQDIMPWLLRKISTRVRL